MPRIPFKVGRSALTNALKYFREGKSPADVLSASKERRSKCGRAKVAAETEDGAKALLTESNDAAHNSQRKMAKKLKVSRRQVRRALKFKLKMKPIRKVVATRNRQAILAKRA